MESFNGVRDNPLPPRRAPLPWEARWTIDDSAYLPFAVGRRVVL